MITVDSLTRLFSSHHFFLHPAAYALGFLDCEDISARCMLTIFQFFATKTDASKLRMLSGSPAERLLKPITDYVEAKGGRLHIRWGCRCFVLLRLLFSCGVESVKRGRSSSRPCSQLPPTAAKGAVTPDSESPGGCCRCLRCTQRRFLCLSAWSRPSHAYQGLGFKPAHLLQLSCLSCAAVITPGAGVSIPHFNATSY